MAVFDSVGYPGGVTGRCAPMRSFQFVVERDAETGVLVGYVPGWPGAHTQGADNEELQQNLREVIEMLLEDGEPELEAEFIDVRTISVA